MLPDWLAAARRPLHVTKLDPDRPLDRARARAVAGSGTDAVVVGGTQGITRAKVVRLLRLLAGAPVPVLVEVSDEACAVPGADGYLVPLVLNAAHPDWLGARHARALAVLGRLVPWERVLSEGYVVANPDSAVGRRVGVRRAPGPRQAAGYAWLGAGIMRLPLIYLEYSGRFGGTRLLAAMRAALDRLREAAGERPLLVYGGGVDGEERARAVLAHADVLVVGNAVYLEDGLDRLAATVAAVRAFRSGGGAHVAAGLRQR